MVLGAPRGSSTIWGDLGDFHSNQSRLVVVVVVLRLVVVVVVVVAGFFLLLLLFVLQDPKRIIEHEEEPANFIERKQTSELKFSNKCKMSFQNHTKTELTKKHGFLRDASYNV